jgi:hypothetical protein
VTRPDPKPPTGSQQEEEQPRSGGADRAAYLPLEVHWSEVEVINRVDPEWPADVPDGTECSMRFFVDTTGVPYDVRPVSCPSELLPATMKAAWDWRFAPIVEHGDTVSASFQYTITKGLIRSQDPSGK